MWYLIIISVLFNITAQLVLKHGLNIVDIKGMNFGNVIRLASSPYVWSGAIIYGASFFVYLFALSKGEIGRISIGAQALTIVGLFSASIIFFHEPLTITKVLGVLLVLCGIFFIFR